MILSINLIMLMTLFLISLLIMMINIFKKKKNSNFQKLSAFECGFQQLTPSSTSMSIPFFLITLIFLIFDIEISIMFPMLNSIESPNKMNLIMYSFIMFFLILIIGLLIEWKNSAINWMKM
uniref:NADH-ubiquinone oxidoreductase chain 3 n=1 Tax=Conostigmus sp. MM-2013 TaxID=1357450 RepID=V9NJP3_9HYME|nr:NADH dehydrogenase subunit 3 [Conostigmus sp. MM-2013]